MVETVREEIPQEPPLDSKVTFIADLMKKDPIRLFDELEKKLFKKLPCPKADPDKVKTIVVGRDNKRAYLPKTGTSVKVDINYDTVSLTAPQFAIIMELDSLRNVLYLNVERKGLVDRSRLPFDEQYVADILFHLEPPSWNGREDGYSSRRPSYYPWYEG